ncbi:hypothetical protein GCM10011428_62160 [Streptomyces violaceus]
MSSAQPQPMSRTVVGLLRVSRLMRRSALASDRGPWKVSRCGGVGWSCAGRYVGWWDGGMGFSALEVGAGAGWVRGSARRGAAAPTRAAPSGTHARSYGY